MDTRKILLDRSGKMIDLVDMGDWMAESLSEEAVIEQ